MQGYDFFFKNLDIASMGPNLGLLRGDVKLIGCSTHIQQPAAANLNRDSYTQLIYAAASWLQPVVMNFYVSPKERHHRGIDLRCYPN